MRDHRSAIDLLLEGCFLIISKTRGPALRAACFALQAEYPSLIEILRRQEFVLCKPLLSDLAVSAVLYQDRTDSAQILVEGTASCCAGRAVDQQFSAGQTPSAILV